MPVKTASHGPFVLPTADYTGSIGKSAKLQELIRRYRPRNAGAEARIATLARVAATLAHPVSGIPAAHGRSVANTGTAGTSCSADEYGDDYHHTTVLTMTAAALTPTIPANAEGAGAIIYTFPAGVYVANAVHLDLTAMTVDSAANQADFGIGSLIASGDIATLTTAAMENWVTGQTIDDVRSPATEKSSRPGITFEDADSHVAHVNIAATWGATVATLDVTGTVILDWTFLGNL